MSASEPYQQEPVAIVGFACRLPGGNHCPQQLWEFLEAGLVAANDVPENRFSYKTHYDGSLKPKTMRQAGGMFIKDIDLADFDAGFFGVGGSEAVSMDPNQRQILEVVYEGLENAGITLNQLENAPIGCFVGSYSSDYADMQARDPEDRPSGNAMGIGRTMMANRISYFLNTKGPSVTLDTACSGSLQGVDVACRYINSHDINAAIVATSNLYFTPEHVIDAGAVGSAHSRTALCHTFDVDADGYVKAEAVSALVLKRLSDAIRDRDPIRGVILGTASNSNGRTAGIASPNAESQAAAIRAAYSRAGITDFNATTYLECHGTGTQAGDPTEVRGVGSVFAETREADKPLIIGSIKSNVGHSEPAAGISGVLKAAMSIEKGWIPGNPTFKTPSPKIDFTGNKVFASRTGIPWPAGAPKRASVNSFGFGGSNAHAIIEAAPTEHISHTSSYLADFDDFAEEDAEAPRPSVLVLSANDAKSLRANIKALTDHLINLNVKVNLADLAYTLSERRSKLWHRAFLSTRDLELCDKEECWTLAKEAATAPKIGFIFTGQGAQWPQMGKDLLEFFPWTRSILEELDAVLQGLPSPPSWSLVKELTEKRSPEHLRQPEFSQPLVTALQICLTVVLERWGIKPIATVGHSSGEIAAAYASGLLDRAGAIVAAFYRGRAAVNCKDKTEHDVGMLAVGLGPEAAGEYLSKYADNVWIACFNSPSSVTVSGRRASLVELAEDLKADGHFARLLQVDLAYHSNLMDTIGEEYETLLSAYNSAQAEDSMLAAKPEPMMYSSATISRMAGAANAQYWKTNMVSPVQFDGALRMMLEDESSPNILVEIGPAGALAGPVSQILKSLPSKVGGDVSYVPAWSRGADAGKTTFDLAGRLWAAGASIDLSIVNEYTGTEKVIVDLPNYKWNHSVKYWHENAASKDWRFRQFAYHDLLGTKLLGCPWTSPIWRSHLNVSNVPWILDHKMGGSAIMPGAGYVSIALEALYQKTVAVSQPEEVVGLGPNDFAYRVRNVRFMRAMVLEEGNVVQITTTLSKVPGDKHWHKFHISTPQGGAQSDHCCGLIRIQDASEEVAEAEDALPLRSPQDSRLWYKAQREVGMDFGPQFQKVLQVEAVSGERKARVLLSLSPPESKFDPQSYYPVHPASLDAFIQAPVPANAQCERVNIKSSMLPSSIDDFFINKVPAVLDQGRAITYSRYVGRGREDQEKNWAAHIAIYDTKSGALIGRVTGLNYVKLDVPPNPDPHTFCGVTWKPDITLMSDVQIQQSLPDKDKLATLIDLAAFKKPSCNVLEINLDETDTSSLWFGSGDKSLRSAYTRYDLGSTSAASLVAAEKEYCAYGEASYHAIDAGKEFLGLARNVSYDLLIVKSLTNTSEELTQHVMKTLKAVLNHGAVTIAVQSGRVQGEETPVVSEGLSTPESPERSNSIFSDASSGNVSSVSSAALDGEAAKEAFEKLQTTSRSVVTGIFHSIRMDTAFEPTTATKLSNVPRPKVFIVGLTKETIESQQLRHALTALGWEVERQEFNQRAPNPGALVLILDELSDFVLTKIDGERWEAVKTLVASGNPLLWVTKGAQAPATDPDRALVHGLFRVARQEDASLKLTTLDVENASGSVTEWAIEKILDSLAKGSANEVEYMERGGLIHCQRIIPDMPLNEFRRGMEEGFEPVVKDLHATNAVVQLRVERLGTFQSLTWAETEGVRSEEQAPPALPEGHVEVEVEASGVNFKDVAITMGIVPDNEYTLGLECSGTVKRLGPGVDKFKLGDRVCMLKSGSYANRVRTHVDRCHIIPDTMTFEEAATLPTVYLTSLYSLFHMANLKAGQSVLIHSATGGVGIACIQLAQYKKAEIYVTVGTEEKRKYLEETYGIHRNRMFSSRDTKFEREIMRETNGKGVNCVINSLVGELLDASWRIVADGGTMVEIGKRDILDRNTLSMEPFDRNCSFRAVDLSFARDMTDSVVSRLFDELFVLINAGHLKPVTPITAFPFDEVAGALSYIRSGRHLGKVVVSRSEKRDVQVPIRPAQPALKLGSDVSYLIVGGLKGACGTLAVHMARHGAKHIIVSSRSGISDEPSARIIRSCNAYGARVVEAKGDVSDLDSVNELFRCAEPKIGGVIQGAMVLRDRPFEMMTLDDFHTAIRAKVQGTWNLHYASELHRAPLGFFTMLSSTSGIVGNKGQANYAAANTFLDAFASFRQGMGLVANTVDLGLLEDVGYAAEQGSELSARFDKRVWTPIDERVLRKVLTYSIMQQSHNAPSARTRAEMITGLGFPLPAEGSGFEGDPRFSYLFNSRVGGGTSGPDAGDAGNSIDEAIKASRVIQKAGSDAGALENACLGVVLAQFARTLRLDTEPETGRPLTAYGLDSLSAVELRNWIKMKLGVELTTLDFTNASSLVALTQKIVSKLPASA